MNDLGRLIGPGGSDDPFAQQRLYEKWLRREEWLLRNEAIPLLLGVAPEAWLEWLEKEDARGAERQAWDAMKDCIMGGLIPGLSGSEGSDESWRVSPSDWYQWCNSAGMPVPAAYEELLQFVLRVLKGPEPPVVSPAPLFGSDDSIRQDAGDREKVLGAALNVLAKCPEKCTDEHGFVSGEAITELILEQSIRWFDSPQPPLSREAMAALIDKWLE